MSKSCICIARFVFINHLDLDEYMSVLVMHGAECVCVCLWCVRQSVCVCVVRGAACVCVCAVWWWYVVCGLAL